ncbi:MAG TPA: site-2 protease family protein [Planctomycetota bacterium]|nr:site-2 protease family protein [Planctomycetota bacterium]
MANPSSWTAGHENEYRPRTSRRLFARKDSQADPEPVTPAENSRIAWSWKLGRVAGIDVYIHGTFLLLILWLVMAHFSQGSSPLETLMGIGFVLALFSCVVLHEYGHALTARRYGIKTRDITLLPIGGLARLERIPNEPSQELLVALAGPAVNVVIAAVLFGILALTGRAQSALDGLAAGVGRNPVADLAVINVWLAMFNLLPAFPMDGGRVLRALLAMKIARVKATRIASLAGQGMAILFGLVGFGLFGAPQPFLLFIALFVFIGATQEYQTIRWESAVEGLSVSDAMVTSFRTLVADDPLSRAVALLLQGTQHDFPVLDENFRVVGLLLRQDLIAALSKDGGAKLTVSTAMRRDFTHAAPDEPLVTVFERMQQGQLPIMPVFDRESGKLLGLLTMENVAEVVMVRNALEKAQAEHDKRG